MDEKKSYLFLIKKMIEMYDIKNEFSFRKDVAVLTAESSSRELSSSEFLGGLGELIIKHSKLTEEQLKDKIMIVS